MGKSHVDYEPTAQAKFNVGDEVIVVVFPYFSNPARYEKRGKVLAWHRELKDADSEGTGTVSERMGKQSVTKIANTEFREAVNNLAALVEEYTLEHSRQKRLSIRIAGGEVSFARDEPTKGISEAIRQIYLLSDYAKLKDTDTPRPDGGRTGGGG